MNYHNDVVPLIKHVRHLIKISSTIIDNKLVYKINSTYHSLMILNLLIINRLPLYKEYNVDVKKIFVFLKSEPEINIEFLDNGRLINLPIPVARAEFNLHCQQKILTLDKELQNNFVHLFTSGVVLAGLMVFTALR